MASAKIMVATRPKTTTSTWQPRTCYCASSASVPFTFTWRAYGLEIWIWPFELIFNGVRITKRCTYSETRIQSWLQCINCCCNFNSQSDSKCLIHYQTSFKVQWFVLDKAVNYSCIMYPIFSVHVVKSLAAPCVLDRTSIGLTEARYPEIGTVQKTSMG